MLRSVALALLLANLLVWAHGQGWLAPLGLAPASQGDPARWAQQVRPDLVRVLPSSAAPAPGMATAPMPKPVPSPEAGSATALACLESDPLPAAQLDAAEQALAVAQSDRGWARSRREIPALYWVAIGPLARDALAKKNEELARLGVSAEEVRLPGDGGWGLVLGRYDGQPTAQTAFDALVKRGVRTARMVLVREAQVEQRLRIENLSPDKAEALRALKVGALGWATCANSSTPVR